MSSVTEVTSASLSRARPGFRRCKRRRRSRGRPESSGRRNRCGAGGRGASTTPPTRRRAGRGRATLANVGATRARMTRTRAPTLTSSLAVWPFARRRQRMPAGVSAGVGTRASLWPRGRALPHFGLKEPQLIADNRRALRLPPVRLFTADVPRCDLDKHYQVEVGAV